MFTPLIHFLRWQNAVDFIVLSAAFYVVLLWARQTRALHFALTIVAFHAAALLAGRFDLTISSWVMDGASLAVIGLVILLFQAELQHFDHPVGHAGSPEVPCSPAPQSGPAMPLRRPCSLWLTATPARWLFWPEKIP
jgi:DNA integrity scanning protein DisA with diadenylate cyclase activity